MTEVEFENIDSSQNTAVPQTISKMKQYMLLLAAVGLVVVSVGIIIFMTTRSPNNASLTEKYKNVN